MSVYGPQARVVFPPTSYPRAMVDYDRAHEWARANAVWSRCAGVVNSPKAEAAPCGVVIDIFFSDPTVPAWLKAMPLPAGAVWEWREVPIAA